MSDRYADAVDRLSRVPGVRLAMVVEAAAGVPVLAEAIDPHTGTALAALAASLFRRGAEASRTAGYGTAATFHLQAADGHVVVAGAGEVLLVVLTEADAQLGLVRLEAKRVAGGLQ